MKLNGSFKETEGTDIAHGPRETRHSNTLKINKTMHTKAGLIMHASYSTSAIKPELLRGRGYRGWGHHWSTGLSLIEGVLMQGC